MKITAVVAFATLIVPILQTHPARGEDYVPVVRFDPSRNADSDLYEAVREAQRKGKYILLEAGGDWCSWCQTMDDFFENKPPLLALRETNFITLKINFNGENRNEKFFSRFPSASGYPHLFVLDSSGRLLHSQSTSELEENLSYNLEKFTEFLKHWSPPEPGFVSLFDGKTLKGWTLVSKVGPGYVIKDGLMVCPKDGGGNIYTEKEYADFIFRFEFRLEPGGNNGVGIRAPLEGRASTEGMEIQILDNEDPKYKDLRPAQYHGSVYDVFPAKRGFLKKPGEWNQEEIRAEGRRITVTLNGTVILDADLDSVKDPEVLKKHPGLARASGHIGFLGHNEFMEFRNIRIRELR